MKKAIVTLMLCLSLFTGGTASAFVPLIVPVIAIGAGALIAAALNFSIMYGMLPKASGSHAVDSSAAVSRSAEAQYIEIDMNSIPTVKHAPLHAHLTGSQVMSAARNGADKYPLLFAQLDKVAGALALTGTENAIAIGTIINSGGHYYKVTGHVEGPLATGNILDVGSTVGTTFTYYASSYDSPRIYNDGTGTLHYFYVNYNSPTNSNGVFKQDVVEVVPDSVPKTPAEFAASLAENGSSGNVKSQYQDELDKMMQDPGYVPTFTDDTTGLPYVPPPNLPTPDQVKAAVDKYNRQGALNESKQNVQAAQSAAVSAAQTAAASAHAAAQQSAAAAAANPGDAGLQAAAARDAASAAAADAALAGAQAEKAKQDDVFANMSASSSTPMPSLGESPKLKSIDLAPVARLKGVLSNTFLGKLASGMSSYIEPLMEEPQAPDFDIPIGKNVIHFDLSCFDSVAVVTRFMSSLLLIVGAAYGVIRFWRGVS